MIPEISVTRYLNAIKRCSPVNFFGKVTKVVGLIIEGYVPAVSVGGTCYIYPKGSSNPILAEVVGFRDRKALLMPLGDLRGVGLGSLIVARKAAASIRVGPAMLGRVIDGLGEPIDGEGLPRREEEGLEDPGRLEVVRARGRLAHFRHSWIRASACRTAATVAFVVIVTPVSFTIRWSASAGSPETSIWSMPLPRNCLR